MKEHKSVSSKQHQENLNIHMLASKIPSLTAIGCPEIALDLSDVRIKRYESEERET